MKITFQHRNHTFECDTSEATSLAITLDFEGPQPNHFGTEKAKSETLKLGSFTGDTGQGGSCNVRTLTLIPHCNGTHTETISHVVNQDIWVGHIATHAMMMATMITVKPSSVAKLPTNDKTDSYRPPLSPTDQIITRAMLKDATQKIPNFDKLHPEALIIRTLPNEETKRSRAYGEDFQPAFLTVEAMQWIDQTNIQHLLLDVPSVDRMYDDGLLTNHHLFWHVAEQSHEINQDSRQDRTITEMIYVDEQLADGFYLLNLQVPSFGSDAAPSRPIVFPAKMV